MSGASERSPSTDTAVRIAIQQFYRPGGAEEENTEMLSMVSNLSDVELNKGH